MQYNSYSQKIKKIAGFLAKLYAHILVISITVVAVTLTTVTLVAAKGIVIKDGDCPTEVEYGDTVSYDAGVFLGKVRFEYSSDGGGTWSQKVPTAVGEYVVRSVGKTSFGNYRYGREQAFVIKPRELILTVLDKSVMYGERPSAAADRLLEGDRIKCEFVYENIAAPTTNICVDKQSVKIFNADDIDVSANYCLIDTPISSIEVTPRPLDITIDSRSQIYNGELLTCEGYESGETLVGDYLVPVLAPSSRLVDVGTVQNVINFTVRRNDGTDMTAKYAMNITLGTLSVEKRPIYVTTQNASYVYSAEPRYATGYTLRDEDREFLAKVGHKLNVLSSTSLTDVGSDENIFCDVELVDIETGEKKTKNYSLFYNYGTIEITPLCVTVQSHGAQKTYDAQQIKVDECDLIPREGHTLIEGHEPIITECPEFVNAGTYENKIIVLIENNDITKNYQITYEYGDVIIDKRPITVTTESAATVFNGAKHKYEGFTADGILNVHDVVLQNTESFMYAGEHENRGDIDIVERLGSRRSVLSNYALTAVYGTVTIEKRDLTLTPMYTEKVYDATELLPLQKLEEHGDLGELLYNGLTYEVSVDGSVTNVRDSSGEASRITDFKLFSGDEEISVTDNCNVTYINGSMNVLPRPIRLITESNDQTVYDAQAHSFTRLEVGAAEQEYPPLENHSFSVSGLPSFTDVGTYDNVGYSEPTVSITDTDGAQIFADNYNIYWQYGEVVINPRPVTVKLKSVAWYYDARAYTYTEMAGNDCFEILPYSDELPLLDGHTFSLGSWGDAPNYRDVSDSCEIDYLPLLVNNGEILISNYDLRYEGGEVTVKPRPVNVNIHSAEWIYDGYKYDFNSIYLKVSEFGNGFDVSKYSNDFPLISGHGFAFDTACLNEFVFKNVTDSRTLSTLPLLVNGGAVDVNNYKVHFAEGSISILPAEITLSVSSVAENTLVYDGEPLDLMFSYTNEDISVGHLFADDVITNVRVVCDGQCESDGACLGDVNEGCAHMLVFSDDCKPLVNGEADNRNYVITLDSTPHPIVITKRPIELYAGERHEIYTGDTYSYDDCLLAKNSLALPKGHTLYGVNIECECKETCEGAVGIHALEFSPEAVTIKAFGERDVTENYDISYTDGILEIGVRESGGGGGSSGSGGGGSGSGGAGAGGSITMSGDLRNPMPLEGTDDMNTLVMKIKGEENARLYLKAVSFGNFFGKTWDAAVEGAGMSGGASADYLRMYTTSHQSLINKKKLEINPLQSNLRVIPYYLTDGDGSTLQISDVSATGDAGAEYLMYYYDYIRSSATISDMSVLEYENEYYAFVCDNYLEVDDQTRAYLQSVIEKEGLSASDIEGVAKYIRGAAKYNLLYDRAMNEEANMVIAFLDQYKEGVCSHYASAATLMYRTLGVPARYCVGYTATAANGEWADVTTGMAHAWVEIYEQGLGWRMVEVTGGADLDGDLDIPDDDTEGPEEITIKLGKMSWVYDGSVRAHSPRFQYLDPAYKNKGFTVELDISFTDVTEIRLSGDGNLYINKDGELLPYYPEYKIMLNGEEQTGYKLRFESAYSDEVVFAITQRPVKIISASREFTEDMTYDELEKKYKDELNTCMIAEGNDAALAGVSINYVFMRDWSTGENAFYVESMQKDAVDVTANYAITYIFGQITVNAESGEK